VVDHPCPLSSVRCRESASSAKARSLVARPMRFLALFTRPLFACSPIHRHPVTDGAAGTGRAGPRGSMPCSRRFHTGDRAPGA
jgi:hypothetical protein